MNPSVSYIKASDGSGDASLMTITQVRTAPATSITVNTVAGVPDKFFGTMGTPHTFTDPVTGETITIISEATAVNFSGHVDSGKIEIDAIADGETDLGSKVGDIIIVRPTTQWADNLHDVLAKSLNDDGSLNLDASKEVINNDAFGDGVVSGLAITYPTTGRVADISAGVSYINGRRVTSVANSRTYTASKDTYISIDQTGAYAFTEVNVAAAAPAIPANSIFIGVITTDATKITALANLNRGVVKASNLDLPTLGSTSVASTSSTSSIGSGGSAVLTLTVPTKGTYLVIGSYQVSGNGANLNTIGTLRKNNITIPGSARNINQAQAGNTWGVSFTSSAFADFEAGDIVTLFVGNTPSRPVEDRTLSIVRVG